ncbi:unnamed protein product [Prorocentrum cordatum]|uniref:Methyltransferase domain-containing protein n=1 Tax=Prorocentrum cordatum TaxID=2364126 RepID=A0ABN9V872_9DINO|nr:unnamed protein product [Polarella glacialis]
MATTSSSSGPGGSAPTPSQAGGVDGREAFQQALGERERSKPQNELILQTVRELSAALVYPEPSNVETNRKLWDEYAKAWDTSEEWVRRMAADVGGRELGCVGDEWSDEASLTEALDDFLFPHLAALERGGEGCGAQVCEIGSGGGRVAARVAGRVGSLTCFDVSMEMLRRAKEALVDRQGLSNVKFVHLTGAGPPDIPARFNTSFDVVYSFDVFVHLDLHTIWQYFCAIHRMLQPGGLAFVSTANIIAPLGWERFQRQRKYSVGGFYFLSPDIARQLACKAGFEVVQESSSQGDTTNVYYLRDYLCVMRKCHGDARGPVVA